ncbi:nucleic acid helicase [Stylonychia lemnae]|uniref:Nucleic acid helicase n=1 Tax=Stylonychia lemnae TaxID=5949 RepID=A0A077ZNR7_STYLE|nr:nucleic acid helicase [Stylonychia lemnae]|eukprot:CDW71563.1 nucleic acid helicase [Stylonychia lemnae]
MQTTIPRKRNYNERQQSDSEDDIGDENTYEGSYKGGPRKRRQTNMDSQYDNEDQTQQKQMQQSIQEMTKNLPIAKHKNQIMRKLEKNRVLVISGDTGCGKTTQVPKYILESADFKKQECKIICTQPRRLAAVNIAKRVAQELGERVGLRVGYQVGMQSRRTKGLTKIIFMTTGIFLQRLVNNPDSIKKCTHIIMDEVHERDLDIDFSLVVIKHLLCKETEGFGFKLILMSATFNIELFTNYFSKSSIKSIEEMKVYVGVEEMMRQQEEEKKQKLERQWGPCKQEDWNNPAKYLEAQMQEDEWVEATEIHNKNVMPIEKQQDPADVIEINARLFEVKEFYLDQLVDNIRKDELIQKSAQDNDLLLESLSINECNKPQIKECSMKVASLLICDVIERFNRFQDDENDKKSILVFLPGLFEIFEFIDFINENYDPMWVRNNLELIPLHSSLCEEEQEKAFKSSQKMDGKRKVIIATNIAESSITIPDIKYVIDFMLTKELFYDPMTKSESLILSWVSKASSKQRAGRAGRVADGLVFRLCMQKFYNNAIPEYPKPEMQRCPLEKLILQIKLWNRYEPEEVLGRAIQPPEFRDICNAIKNLQQTGALTIPPPFAQTDEDKRTKITALGKIFVNLPCDLKITRLFLFGMALKCMSQAIIMGCLHQQSRSIFRSNRVHDLVNMTKLQCIYDNNRDSDSMMLLRVFQEWIHKFHPHLKHKQNPTNQNPTNQVIPQRPVYEHRRLRFSRPSHCKYNSFIICKAERQWCRDRNLDLSIMKEVATMVEEVRQRFQKMNIPEKCLNSKVKLRDDNPDAILIMKLCIGGAFYNKYVKAAYKNEDTLAKMASSSLFVDDEAKRAIILNKVSEHIQDHHLKQYFEGKFKVNVESVKISMDKPTIIFGPEILERGFIKACFKLGLRTREEEYVDQTKFKSRIFGEEKAKAQDVLYSYQEIQEQLENEELRRPLFLYEIRFETLNKDAYVEFERDSINNFAYELDENKLMHVTYACQDYYDKGGRFMCRNSTRLPDVPMVDALYCLLFAPIVQVKANSKKQFFEKIICDEGELIIKLTHILTHQDLEIIQKIRSMMNETLCNEDNLKQAHLAQVDFFIKRLFSFNRISVDVFEKLNGLREEDKRFQPVDSVKDAPKKDDLEMFMEGDGNFFMEEETKNTQSLSKEGEGYDEVDNFEGEEQTIISNSDLKNRQQRYEKECSMGYFLQPIYVQKLKQKIYFYDELVRQMEEEFKKRVAQKRKIIEKIRQKAKELDQKDVTVICDRCKQDIAPLKTFDYISDDLHYAKCVFGALRRVEIQEASHSQYDEDREFIDIFLEIFEKEKFSIPEEQLYISTPQNNKIYYFAFSKCRQNHIVGIVKNQRFYMTDISPIQLLFPNSNYQTWDSRFWQKGYSEAMKHLSRTLLLRAQSCQKLGFENKDGHKIADIYCELCHVILKGPDDFVAHCKGNKEHKDLETKFLSSDYDQLLSEQAKKGGVISTASNANQQSVKSIQ